MKVEISYDGIKRTVEMTKEEIEKMFPVKKTGYERVGRSDIYYGVGSGGRVYVTNDNGNELNETVYDTANYYSDETVAKNNARADTLYRKLRRFAVEHRVHTLDWKISFQQKWYIYYDYCGRMGGDNLCVACYREVRDFGNISFDSQKTAEAAIKEFKDELIWYFTEYKDSL